MGLIRAAMGAAGGVMADQWKEYFYCEAMPADLLATRGWKRQSRRSANTKGNDNIISNGSIVAVADGQCAMIVEQGKVVDMCAEPGEYTYDDGNTYDDLGNTNWYGWFRMENYKNVPNRDYFDTDTYDCWGYIGESEDGSHYFEVYRDGMPDAPVITMWVNVYDDHIEPILDGYDWVLDQNITESDAYKFNLYPYNDSISLFMYDYEGDDGTACAVSFYMRLDGTEWNEELEELPPRYEEYKAALAKK